MTHDKFNNTQIKTEVNHSIMLNDALTYIANCIYVYDQDIQTFFNLMTTLSPRQAKELAEHYYYHII